jgi:hypothetical protein
LKREVRKLTHGLGNRRSIHLSYGADTEIRDNLGVFRPNLHTLSTPFSGADPLYTTPAPARLVGVTTGERRDIECAGCGDTLPHFGLRYRSTSGTGTLFVPRLHTARCGAFCRGATAEHRRDCAGCAREAVRP